MKFLDSPDKMIFYFDTTSLGVSSVNGNATISSGPDDGTNDTMAKAFYLCRRHLTTDEASENLLQANIFGVCGAIFPWVLSGHGSEGSIETGGGQMGGNKDNTIEFYNRNIWLPLLSRLSNHPAKILRLSSCHTGAGEEGADLLFLIAKQIGKTVEARTGFTCVTTHTRGDEIWYEVTYEDGSQWQTATPTNRPTAINPPHKIFKRQTYFNEIIFFKNNTYNSFKLRDIFKVSISSNIKNKKITYLERKDITFFIPFLFKSEPFKLSGHLQAFITGFIFIRIGNEEYEFEIYNGQLLKAKNSNYYYYTDTILINLLLT